MSILPPIQYTLSIDHNMLAVLSRGTYDLESIVKKLTDDLAKRIVENHSELVFDKDFMPEVEPPPAPIPFKELSELSDDVPF